MSSQPSSRDMLTQAWDKITSERMIEVAKERLSEAPEYKLNRGWEREHRYDILSYSDLIGDLAHAALTAKPVTITVADVGIKGTIADVCNQKDCWSYSRDETGKCQEHDR